MLVLRETEQQLELGAMNRRRGRLVDTCGAVVEGNKVRDLIGRSAHRPGISTGGEVPRFVLVLV
jgi:hypothetical protein